MRFGLLGLIGAGAAIAALVVTAHGADSEFARATISGGVSTVWRKGETTNLSPEAELRENDIVRVPEGSRLKVEYEDGSSISLVGPAALRFGPMDSQGRRVVLGSGAASEVVVKGTALEIQAPNPYDASMVLQDARGFARVNPGDRIVFQKTEGAFAKVWREGHYIDLGSAPWVLNVREEGSPREENLGEDVVRIVVGGVTIVIQPASEFSREWSTDGGLKLQYIGSGDSFGEVDIGQETSVYVYEGQSLGFDSNGDVTRFEGVAHLNRPLINPVPTDDPVENGADASPSFSRRR